MSNKPSKKHHYLPRYYLKGFTNDGGSFFVYDKNTNKIFETNPDASFFQNDLNTVEFPNGEMSDFLEGAYTEIENQSWNSLDNIRNSTRKISIQPLDRMNLFLFLLFLHWRLPGNIAFIDKLSGSFFNGENDLDFFNIFSKSSGPVPEEIKEAIRSSSAFKKAAKVVVPFAPFYKDKDWLKNVANWRFLYSGDGNNWFIVGDNPIITHGDKDHDPVNCLKEFIFPVSGKVILINADRAPQRMLPGEFVIEYGAAILERAQRFVACPNKEFLETLVKYYKVHVELGKTNIIINELFKMLQ